MIIVYWLIGALILAGFEAHTLGLTTIWFAGGALVAALFCGLGFPLWVQIVVFAAVSILMLVLTRPLAMKYLNSRTVKTNVDGMAGKTGLVTQPIDNLHGKGQVDVDGQLWTARSTDDDILIDTGTKVTVKAVQGVKLIIKIKEEDHVF